MLWNLISTKEIKPVDGKTHGHYKPDPVIVLYQSGILYSLTNPLTCVEG
uniref:Uncharacterized protein n=1 Tax=Rhizophora mucronata TaxID=61149 RepID=A0A2P2IIQ9_RHIMU